MLVCRIADLANLRPFESKSVSCANICSSLEGFSLYTSLSCSSAEIEIGSLFVKRKNLFDFAAVAIRFGSGDSSLRDGLSERVISSVRAALCFEGIPGCIGSLYTGSRLIGRRINGIFG